MPWLNLRSINIEDDCEAEIETARNAFPRFDEAFDGIKWLLERNPTPPGSFLSIQRDGIDYYIYGFRGDGAAGTPDMWVFYSFDETDIDIYGINANEVATEEEEDGAD